MKRVESLIDGTEILASRTCEACGSTENVKKHSNGWLKTLCAECDKKREAGENIWF